LLVEFLLSQSAWNFDIGGINEMANNYEKESKEGYDAGKKGESADKDPYKNDTASGRMGSIIEDVITANISNRTQEQDNQSEAWRGGHAAGSKDKEK